MTKPVKLEKTEYTTETLIAEWMKKHETESDDEYKVYGNADVPKCAFLPDGIINEACYAKAEIKVLFVAKESHCSDYKENGYFWLRGVANNEGQGGSRFSKRLAMLMNAIVTGDYENVNNTDYENLKKAAFINLNKRGGKAQCNWKTLKGYVEKYCEYIKTEIELINPDVIICCGSGLEYLMNEYIKPEKQVLCIAHPSYRRLSNKGYLKELKEKMDCIKNR